MLDEINQQFIVDQEERLKTMSQIKGSPMPYDQDPDDSIYAEIESERAYQRKRWGNTADDTLNTPWMWVAYISAYATKWMVGTFAPLEVAVVDDFRAKMIKTAAICVAAVESIDRQREKSDAAFYEKNGG